MGGQEDGDEPRDEITIGTEHWWSDEWRGKGRVAGAKLKPDLVWLRRDSGDLWRKVVVDVKVTSTDRMNEAFKEKDEKYREWATRETREKKVSMAVMVPVIISHDGAVHKNTVKRWKASLLISMSIGYGWHNTCFDSTLLSSEGSSTKGAGCLKPGERTTQRKIMAKMMALPKELLQWRKEPGCCISITFLRMPCVCGLRARHLHAAFG